MNNPRIGQLAAQLSNLEDAGKSETPEYHTLLTEYETLKSLPESWSDVLSRNWTQAQAQAAVSWHAAEIERVLHAGLDDWERDRQVALLQTSAERAKRALARITGTPPVCDSETPGKRG